VSPSVVARLVELAERTLDDENVRYNAYEMARVVVPLAEDWKRLKRIEEAARENVRAELEDDRALDFLTACHPDDYETARNRQHMARESADHAFSELRAALDLKEEPQP
jgi:predicted ATPase